MLAMFSFSSPAPNSGTRSILCRILNGQSLDTVRAADMELLSDYEREHYSTLADPHLCALHCRGRAELRRMLAREIEVHPKDIPIMPGAHGKPMCPLEEAAQLDFNVAHSCECTIIAMGEARRIGVDVEAITGDLPPPTLVEAVFHPTELAQWLTLPTEQRCAAFTHAWVIKEAALKAEGISLDGSPQEIRVRFDSKGQTWPAANTPGWTFERLQVSSHYAAWLAVMI